MDTWYEKALIPFVYGRLNRNFSFDEINDPQNAAAAANGQFILVRRDAYNAVGGHASIAGEVLEDVALAKLVKRAGYSIWFGSGKGFVRVRMYRSFPAMWAGWRKNLYQLEGGSPAEVYKQLLAECALLLGPLASHPPGHLQVASPGVRHPPRPFLSSRSPTPCISRPCAAAISPPPSPHT